MSKQVCIKGDAQSLILGPQENEYLSVAFASDGLRFEVKTYLYNDAQALAQFFKDLAHNLQGWSGTKTWKSIESDFKLDATNDGTSYMNLKVSLIKNQGEENESNFVGKMKLELGTIESISIDVDTMFNFK